jgi:hypothetical protein
MTDDERTLESLKLLRESSAWMVGVQTAIFGFLITLLNAGQLELGSVLIKGAVTAFGLSIVCAGVVLGAIPWVLNRKPLPASTHNAPIADWPLINHIPIGWASGLQYLAFVVGLVCLASAVIWKQIG